MVYPFKETINWLISQCKSNKVIDGKNYLVERGIQGTTLHIDIPQSSSSLGGVGGGSGEKFIYKTANASNEDGGSWKCLLSFEANQFGGWGENSIYELKPLNGGEPIPEKVYNGSDEMESVGDDFLEFTEENSFYIYLVSYITISESEGRSIEFKIEKSDSQILSHRHHLIATLETKNDDDSNLQISNLNHICPVTDGWWFYPRYPYMDDVSTDSVFRLTIENMQIRIGGQSKAIENEDVTLDKENSCNLLQKIVLSSGDFTLDSLSLNESQPDNSGVNIYCRLATLNLNKNDSKYYITSIDGIGRV